ncbi:hypothetical protein [Mucilaginibacter sp. 44-25]|uniref:hypothetical protein n=1 Tax=Mucilaginibacter sp. 44-25 TaxID=1895794 RepID=UPI000964C90B|nr:hypothetical protein [Mucilaginibacter sp. 44-25]OJW15319.1 MAG: hypothetical protein BGO48_14420 [Mucilaginibacter sp. 44-25]
MKHLLFFLTALLFISFSAFAQSNYQPGYYISLKGDTVRGSVDYREWSTNPESINFKGAGNNAATQRLLPASVRSICIKNIDYYQSYSGNVSADVLGNTNGRDTSFTTKSIFLKSIINGDKLNLYEYRDADKTRYFVAANGQEITELIYRSYQLNDQSIDERTYRKQLSIIAANNNKLNSEVNNHIQRTEYNADALTRLVKEINTNNISLSANINTGRKSAYFFAGTGVNIIMFRTDGGVTTAGAPNKTSVLPVITGGLNVYPNPHTRQLALRVETGVGIGRYSAAYTSKVSPYNDAVFNFTEVNFFLAPQILYNVYNQNNFKFFIGAGLQASLINYTNKAFRNADGSPSTLSYQPFGLFIKTATASLFKAGILIRNKIELNAGYLTESDICKDPYYRITATGVQIGINYHFE